MQFPTDDEENDFTLNTGGRSRLSSLFQSENAVGDINQALKFQAPKQPKKHDTSQSNSASFKLIHATVVHAYKLKDGNYVNQGKLGCAVLGIHDSESYRLILYKGKTLQITYTNIVPSFQFQVQPNNYINFYDEIKENWSINLDTETALVDLVKQIALAKSNCESKNRTTLIIQNLVLGEGSSLENGDAAEVRYTGWLLTNYAFGQVFDSNMNSESAFRLRLGKSKVIKGWSEGLLGAQKGTKRLLIVPPSLGYGSEGMGSAVPPNSTLIFELQVTKVKKNHESSHSPSPIKVPESVIERKPEVPHRPSISSHDDNIRMRGASISEQLSQSPKKDKAQLISRMAKMGTATLPLPGAIVAHISSESESEEEPQEESPAVQINESRSDSPKQLSRPNTRSNSVSSNVVQPVEHHTVQDHIPVQVTQQTSQISMFTQAAVPSQQSYMPQQSAFPYQPQLGSPFHMPQAQYQMPPAMLPPASMADTHLPLLLSETRSQNTEVRMGLSKIVDKVDTVIQKVDDLRLQQGRGISQTAFMDSAIILQNIERIVQENKLLKEDVEAKNSKVQILNEKVCDLLQRNQRFFEESNNMLEQKSDSMQAISSQSNAKVFALEEEKAKLVRDLTETTSKLMATETELHECQAQLAELRQKLLDNEKAAGDTNDLTSENDSLLSTLRDQVQFKEEEKSVLMAKLAESEKQCKDLFESNTSFKTLIDESKLKIEEAKTISATELSEMKGFYEKQITEYEEKLNSTKSNIDATTSRNESKSGLLKGEIKHLLEEKDKLLLQIQERDKKYEVFYSKTRAMKDQYESKVSELIAELKHLQATEAGSTDFSGEIKKMMNTLYKLLQGKFEADTSYTGSKVLEMSLQVIRGLTLQMLKSKGRAPSKAGEIASEADQQTNLEQSRQKSIISKDATSDEKTSSESSKTSALQNGHDIDSNLLENTENQAPLVEYSSVSSIPESKSKTDQSEDSQLPQSIAAVVKQDHPEKRISPEMWKPQPPPLFDDDDEDDDDDWMK